ncbi:putative membrane protein (plasmid) [Bacillus pseudomycoides]|nr:putative membrane protein [Bacillus pseudomycoides]AJI14561.1 putative membrane protein [Bacillus pseudomycoides]
MLTEQLSLQIILIIVKFIRVIIMRKSEKDNLSWKIFKLWISIPRSIRLAFLWSILIGFSYLGWVKIIRKLFE